MTEQCCHRAQGGRPSRRLVRRVSTVAASILPAAALALLPKCPLCLAAWLTVVTGVGFSAAGAAWVRAIFAVIAVVAVALAAAPFVRRRAFGHLPIPVRRPRGESPGFAQYLSPK